MGRRWGWTALDDELAEAVGRLEDRVESHQAQLNILIATHPRVDEDGLPPRPVDPCVCACGCSLHVFPWSDRDRCVWCVEGDHA